MEKDSGKDIELRSEEVQEVMGQIPAWIVRWGITVLFLVVMALLIGSYFFKYPDVITADMTLTGQHPATAVVTRAAGKIQELLVTDNRPVKEGDWLAIIENHANTGDILYLGEALERYGMEADSLGQALLRHGELSLGDIQPAYSGLLAALHACVNYKEIDYYPQKIASTRKLIALHKTYYEEIDRQRRTLAEQYALAEQQYARDSLLYSSSVISSYEHETARAALLQNRYSLEGAAASAENLRIQIGQQEQALLDLTLEQSEREFVLRQDLQTAREQLLNSLNEWRLRYCLVAPVGGVVTFTNYWNENQYIPSGEMAFTIVPQGDDRLMGKVRIPIVRSGKVRKGQRVIVRFSNFPDQEFGVVNGVVANISLVPADEFYTADIDFPEGLRTNYGIDLPVSPETQATAEIVTEELRLIERFFLPIKRVVKEGFGAVPPLCLAQGD